MPTGNELINLLDLKKLSDYTVNGLNSKSDRIISFSTGQNVILDDAASDVPFLNMNVALPNPTQSGSGDPSPDNIRPFVGVESIQIKVSPNYDYSGNRTQTYNIALSRPVYGGQYDVITGICTSSKLMKTFNDSNSNGWTVVTTRGTVTQFRYSMDEDYTGEGACNMFAYGSATNDLECFFFSGSAGMLNKLNIQIRTDRLSENTVQGLMAYFSEHPLQVFCDTNMGNFDFIGDGIAINTLEWMSSNFPMRNYVGSNVGALQVRYYAVTEQYIKNITNAHDEQARTAISSGDYFFVGNTLCIATADIARNENIVIGTNCTKTDLAAALNALKNGS